MTAFNSSSFRIYTRTPVKKAPAPSAITVRSRKIHSPKAKRLSMLVWFKPLIRHKPAEYSPNASSATHGVIHKRNRLGEHRRTPRVMKSLSTGDLRSGLVRPRRMCDLPHPLALRSVIDLGLGAQLFEQPEALRFLRRPRRLARGVVQIAEADRTRRAGLHAGRRVLHRLSRRFPRGRRKLFGRVPSPVAEIALLHNAPHARRHIGIQRLLHPLRPGRVPPVEVTRVIRAGRHAVPAPQAPLRHLSHHARRRVQIHRLLRAHVDAGRVVVAVLAHHRHKGRAMVGILFPVIHFVDPQPRQALAVGGAFVRRRNVVLYRAGHHAGPAPVAAVHVDGHPVFGRVNRFDFGDHALTTFARTPAPHTSSTAARRATSTAPRETLASTLTSTSIRPASVSTTARAPSSTPAARASSG